MNKKKQVNLTRRKIKIPKGHKESSGKTKIPLVYCSKCRKYQVARITNMEIKDKKDKRKKFKMSIISCVVCEIVQNMGRIPKMKYITYKELKQTYPESLVYTKL